MFTYCREKKAPQKTSDSKSLSVSELLNWLDGRQARRQWQRDAHMNGCTNHMPHWYVHLQRRGLLKGDGGLVTGIAHAHLSPRLIHQLCQFYCAGHGPLVRLQLPRRNARLHFSYFMRHTLAPDRGRMYSKLNMDRPMGGQKSFESHLIARQCYRWHRTICRLPPEQRAERGLS